MWAAPNRVLRDVKRHCEYGRLNRFYVNILYILLMIYSVCVMRKKIIWKVMKIVIWTGFVWQHEHEMGQKLLRKPISAI